MSQLRLPYFDLVPDALSGFRAVKTVLENGSLGAAFIELVYLRISQINGCAYCLTLHAKALREHDVSQAKLDSLAGWRVSALYSPRERAALEWAEALTDITGTHADDPFYVGLQAHFDAKEIAELTFAISLMNALNRLAIGMRQ